MRNFPFISQMQSLVLLRVSLAGIFMAHAIVRLINGTTPQFGGFLDTKGLLYGVAIVWAITVFEILGGVLMALGYFIKWLSLGFILMLIVGIAIIHYDLGWFVGEHGSGGCEYSIILIIALIVVATDNNKEH